MKFKKLLATVAAATMLVACGGGGTTTSTGTQLKEGDTVKIGFVGPLTGGVSSYGIPVANSIEMAVADYNASADAKYKIELVKEDSAGDATQATNAYKKLVSNDKVAAIVGPVITAEGLALGAASQEDKTPMVSSSTSGDTITLNSDGTTRYNYFRTCSNDSMGGQTIAKAISNGTITGVKKVAILTNTDSDFSQGCVTSFKTQAATDNVNVVIEKAYNDTTKDFRTQITEILATGADTVYIPDYYETIATIVKQFKDAGFKGTFLGTDGWDGVLGIEGVDKSLFNGAYYTNVFDDRADGVINYVKAYKAKFNGETNMFGTMAYDATWVVIKAIEAAGTTNPDDIIKALEATNYEGITGTIQFNEQHNPSKDLIVKTIKNGEYAYLD